MNQRTLHLIDIENLAGTGHVDALTARRIARDYRAFAQSAGSDLLVVACSHHSGFPVAAAFPDASVRWRSGPDGADIALIEAAIELPLARFDRLVLGSGDGIFLALVRRAKAAGIPVHVVARRCGAARTLVQAADYFIEFADPAPLAA
jgi:hypothetical protein